MNLGLNLGRTTSPISTQTDLLTEKNYSIIPTQTSYNDSIFDFHDLQPTPDVPINQAKVQAAAAPITESPPTPPASIPDIEIKIPIITSYATTETECELEWTKQSGVTFYMISCLKIGSDIKNSSIQRLDPNINRTVLSNLEAGVEYQILLTAFNKKNKYKNSKYLILKTNGIPPTKPQRIVFQVSSLNSIQINWGEPEFLNGTLAGYFVSYHPIGMWFQNRIIRIK